MVKTWADEAADCGRVVEPILENLRDEIAPDLEWELIPDLGSEFDAIALDLVRKSGRLRIFVTFEAWVNASTDPADIQDQIRQLVKKVGRSNDITCIITSAGVFEKPKRTPTQRLLDDAAGIEADAELAKFRKSLGTPG